MSDRPLPTVLFVDDNADTRLTVAMILASERYRVLQAANGSEALRFAPEADVVILDVGLPDISGLEVCRRIKADPATSQLPVVLLSGHFTGNEDLAGGLEGGGDVYLVKPANPRVLLAQVKALLRIRQAELALREQALIIEQIHDAVVATDLEGRITRWNKGAQRLFGYPPEEVLGRDVGLLDIADGDGKSFAWTVAQVREKGSCDGEKAVRIKGGDELHVQSSYSLLRDRQGGASGVICYSIDVSERRRLEEKVRQAERLKAIGQLAGGVAHDFNNLLTVVNGYSEILLGTMYEGDPNRDIVEEIKKAGERAASLTRQLLAFGRRQFLSARRIDLNALARDAARSFAPNRGDVEVRTALAEDLSPVNADPAQIRQVLMNLIANALDAMPGGGTVTIETKNADFKEGAVSGTLVDMPPGRYSGLAVADTGCGMTREIQSRVFEPFFTTKRFGEGSGLGLSTVYGIVRQSGGYIEVRSEPERGSTFTVYLPGC